MIRSVASFSCVKLKVAVMTFEAIHNLESQDYVVQGTEYHLDLCACAIRDLTIDNKTFDPGSWEHLKLEGVKITSLENVTVHDSSACSTLPRLSDYSS